MSLFKLPFIAGATLGLHAATTAPNPPPKAAEKRIEPTRLEFMLTSPLFRNAQKVRIASLLVSQKAHLPHVKAVYWAAALAEIGIIGGGLDSSSNSPWSERVVSALAFGGAPHSVRITPSLVLGSGFVVSGALLRLYCYSTLGKYFTFETGITRNHRLVTTGPYSLCRHPSYTGAVLAYFGILFYFGSPGSWFVECVFKGSMVGKVLGISYALMMSLIVAGLLSRIEKEDEGLKREFGQDWVEYAAKVPYVLVPGVY